MGLGGGIGKTNFRVRVDRGVFTLISATTKISLTTPRLSKVTKR